MTYRADIDGLRAVAVLLVILFHFGLPGVTGGYIGVDVFFVLSGYLIGTIVFAKLDQDSFSFIDFYFRRFRRLFPAFAAMLVFTCCVAYMLFLPQDFREFGQSLLASAVYASNVLFFIEAGYFDTASHLKPLLHTWSLSVEEQFYIVFPALAWLFARGSSLRSRRIIFVSLLLVSFFAAVIWMPRDSAAVFYLYPFRAWEMFLGTVLALGCLPDARRRVTATLLGSAGALLIIVPAFTYTSDTAFPGLTALSPCIGTIMIIQAGGRHENFLSRVLSTPIAVYVGRISYSLYLWHWPIYVFYSYVRPGGLSVTDTIAVAAATFLVSALSYRYIETPIRTGSFQLSRSHKPVFTAVTTTTIVFAGAGLFVHLTDGMPGRLDARTAAIAHAAGDLFGDTSDCAGYDNATYPDVEFCTIGDPTTASTYTLVWGDSHGGAYRRGLTRTLEAGNHSALIAWTGGCPPVFGVEIDESVSSRATDERCYRRNEAVRQLLSRDQRINSVVLIGRWSYYASGHGVGIDASNKIALWPHDDAPRSVGDQREFFATALSATLTELDSAGHRVFVVEQPPEIEWFHARNLAVQLITGAMTVNESQQQYATVSYTDVVERQRGVKQMLDAAEQSGRATILRTHDLFCTDLQCSAMQEDIPVYFDNNHLSSLGSEKLGSMFDPVRDFLRMRHAQSL